jgi:hypothetical protein
LTCNFMCGQFVEMDEVDVEVEVDEVEVEVEED